jgi:two-component system response regulator PilR (NtrC family)
MNPSRHRLLVVDDEPDLRTLYEITLVREGYDVECAATVEEAWQCVLGGGFHAVITDVRLPDGSGLDLVRRIERSGSGVRTVVITAYGSPQNAVEALKSGAFDYLTKPVDLSQFRHVVASAVGRTPARTSAPGDGSTHRSLASPAVERLVGESAAMRQVRELVEKVARSMAPVLIAGESGTGKELVARAIHDASPRAAMPFVAVNCGAIPDNLLEAEFFGYRRGAFTGAQEDREGFFQAAQGGTLFLDEIGDLPLAMQSKLLRVIQERAVRPVGATAEARVDVRIVSATHRDLVAEARAGRFRQDLYFRLDVIRITLPPLRDRAEDLPALCAALMRRIARESAIETVPRLAPQALVWLSRHPLPGNVRELENMLHRALALCGSDTIDVADLAGADSGWGGLAGESAPEALPSIALGGVAPAPGPDQAPGLGPMSGSAVGFAQGSMLSAMPGAMPGAASIGRTASSAFAAGAAMLPLPDPLPADLERYLDDVERRILEAALLRYRFNRTAAGASLGLSLRQIRYRMSRLGIQGGFESTDVAPLDPV